ncbi:MAG: cation transporter [Crocinitomicaceae bacterium]|nr:cation diffusion facilitator family transporter [Flavobacteriales bacterium]NQZ38244.1 cation transporter [Crocinitomicaceae bacterium]
MSTSTKSHSHAHEAPDFSNVNRAFFIGIALNSIFTLIEFIVGYSTNSLALIADASHNLSDVTSLILSLVGLKLAQKASTRAYTYGYKKASILASLINSILLVAIAINISIEGIERLNSLPEIAGIAVITTAFIGVLINTFSAFLFYKGQQNDINIKGAFLHLLVDALVSVGVMVSGIIMYYTNWNLIDPIISFIIAIVILISTWSLLKESLKLILDGKPKNVDFNKVQETILSTNQVKDIHHVHIWALSSFENALTAHIVFKENTPVEEYETLKKEIKTKLAKENISHVTLEVDESVEDCNERTC